MHSTGSSTTSAHGPIQTSAWEMDAVVQIPKATNANWKAKLPLTSLSCSVKRTCERLAWTKKIAQFILLAAKLEFFLVNLTHDFAHVDGETRAVRGVNWDGVGQSLEGKHPFKEFDFVGSGFQVFKETTPQLLIAKDGSGLKWDSDEIEVSSWQVLLGRSYAQLRNNIAHGNKAQLSAPFTHDRTMEFLEAGHHLIHFIAGEHTSDESWSYAIQFS